MELEPFCLFTSKMGQWREGVHMDQFLGHGVEVGGSGNEGCAPLPILNVFGSISSTCQ